MTTAKGKTTRTAAAKSIAAKSKAAAKPARPSASRKASAPGKSSKSDTSAAAPASSGGLSLEKAAGALFGQLKGYTDMVAGGLMDVARVGSAIPMMASDNWLKDLYSKAISPERLSAMADAGNFLRDAREVAGLNLQELATALGLSDTELLEEVEQGRATLPFDMILRVAALIARHDPIPFILNFLRTYNPALEKRLDYWGITALPKQYERERRFVNLVRQHDVLREMSDAEFDRFIGYQASAINLTLEVMASEKSANQDKTRKPRG
jgi:transcriptional regulator with XRE-family HTH domain